MHRLDLSFMLLGTLLLSACASPETGLAGRLDERIAETAIDRVQVSALAVSLGTGRVLYERAPRLLMHPASTMKLVTTVPVCVLKPELTVVTRLQTSNAEGGVLTIVGGADPMLSTADLLAMVTALHGQGVRHITEIRYHDPMAGRPRFGEGWMWDDEPGAFMPHLSGLTVEGGTVEVVARGEADGLRVGLAPESDHTPLEVRGGDKPLRIHRDWRWGSARIVVTGTLPRDQERRRSLSVPNPARHTSSVLKTLLVEAGMASPAVTLSPTSSEVSGATPACQVEHRRALPPMLAHANKPSDNLTAELLLRHLGTADGHRLGTAADGHQVIADFLGSLGFKDEDFRLSDGSGVSHYNLVSPELLVGLLVHAWNQGAGTRQLLTESLAIAGVDGTLGNRMTRGSARGRVRAKTGSISGVSTIAGYLETASGEPVAFAIMIQNFTGSPRPWRALQDGMLELLAASR